MNTLPTQSWTAAQVLSAYPQTAQVFFHLKTDCVGCVLSRFCTLEKIAKTYQLELNLMLESIQQTAIPH
jgi:hypothetical protein